MDKTYRLVCDDGEEDRLSELAQYVKAKVEHLRREVGNPGDERLMLMAALLIADELFEQHSSVVEASTETMGNADFAVQKLRATAAKMATEKPTQGQAAVGGKGRKRDIA